MQDKIKLISMVGAVLIAATAGASAQGYDRFGYGAQVDPGYNSYGYAVGTDPGYWTTPPRPMYYGRPGAIDPLNGSNHPTPSSTQGDVGPGGNNNGTLTGYYRRW